MDYAEAPDEIIIEGVRRGDGRAVAALYDRYGSLVFSLGLRMLGNREAAEELVQEAFLRAWRQIATYQPSLGRVSNWLLGIARNLAIDELRRRGARPQTISNDENDDQITQIATSHEEDPAEQRTGSRRKAHRSGKHSTRCLPRNGKLWSSPTIQVLPRAKLPRDWAIRLAR